MQRYPKIKQFFFLFAVTLLLTALTHTAHAQPINPCGNDDIDGNCPLDTWVYVLAFLMLTFSTLHLYRKKDIIAKA